MENSEKNKTETSKRGRLRIVPLEKLQDDKKVETTPTPVRHSTRTNAGSNLITRKRNVESSSPEETSKRRRPGRPSKPPIELLPTNIPTKTPQRHRALIRAPRKRKTPNVGLCPNEMLELNINEDIVERSKLLETSGNVKEVRIVESAKKSPTLLDFNPDDYPSGDTINLDIAFEDDGKPVPRRRFKKPPEVVQNTRYFKMDDHTRGVRCVKCNSLVAERVWPRHNTKNHNNLSWRDGDTPVDFTNKDLIFNLWGQVIHSKLTLKCPTCDEKKISIEDFYSHLQTCGKTTEVVELAEVKKPKPRKKKSKKTPPVLLTFNPDDYPSGDTVSLDIAFEMDFSVPGVRGRRMGGPEVVTHNTKLFRMDNGTPGVRCVKCNILLAENAWSRHNIALHNNVAWRDGDTPVDFTNKELVFRLWKQVLKAKQMLKCPTCGETKLSHLGFYSHHRVCGKDAVEVEAQKVKCNICLARVQPTSLKMHMIMVHRPRTTIDEASNDKEPTQLGQRKAANKALTKFKELETPQTPNISDFYSNEDRPENAPSYYISVWKSHISNKLLAKCLSPGCSFATKILDEIVQHYESCQFATKKMFFCKECVFKTTVQKDIIFHVKSTHLNTSKSLKDECDDDDYDDVHFEPVEASVKNGNHCQKVVQKPPRKNKDSSTHGGQKQFYKFKFLLDVKEKLSDDHTFSPSFLWTKTFRKNNYLEFLYPEYLINSLVRWTQLPEYCTEQYIPKVKNSIPISRIVMHTKILDVRRQHHDWKSYDLFEVDMDPQVVTIFCGGPVRSLAWVPMPLGSHNEQYLAVACKFSMETFHKLGSSYSGPGLIEIWNFGVLNNGSGFQQHPNLAFSIAHDYGVVWHMEWCPSGCYQEDARLGLLAVGCSDSFVYIISVPVPLLLPASKNSIYKSRPIFKLYLQEENESTLGETPFQVTKLTWSKSSGHDILAAGYSNGMIALWNLQDKSPLLHEIHEDVVHLFPYLMFQGHSTSVTVIDFGYFADVRWLVTGSMDQTIKFWDLHNVQYPITEHRRGLTTDGVWFPHWNCAVICCDDAFSHSQTVASIVSNRDFGYKPVPIFRTNSPCTSLSASEWMNTLVQGSVAGEVQFSFMIQAFYGLDHEKNLRSRRMLGSFAEYLDRSKTGDELVAEDKKRVQLAKKDLKELSQLSDSDVEVLPFHYKEAAKKYGVVFCDFDLNGQHNLPKDAYDRCVTSEVLKEFPYDMYPITAINRLTWNPNENSFRYLAIGYEVGFVRVQWVNIMQCRYQ